MSSTQSVRIKNLRNTEENWLLTNPILLSGEMVLVDTADGTVRQKIGDGTSVFNELPYVDDAYVLASSKGQAGGVAMLNGNGKVPADQLPNYTEVGYVPSDEVSSLTKKQIWTSEQTYNYEDYGLVLKDTVNGIACGFKAPRGFFNQLFISDFVFPRNGTLATDELADDIGFYIFTGVESKAAVRDEDGNITTEGYNNLLGYEKVAGISKDGGLILKSSTTGSNKYFKLTVNDSGQITATQVG